MGEPDSRTWPRFDCDVCGGQYAGMNIRVGERCPCGVGGLYPEPRLARLWRQLKDVLSS